MDFNLVELLQRVARGELPVAEAETILSERAETNLGFARVDLDRLRRRGLAEVIFCPGKTADQIVRIMSALIAGGQNVLATRATPEQYAVVQQAHAQAVYHELPKAITIRVVEPGPPVGQVTVVCAGTSDIPVAEEAALTAEIMGARLERIYDVGVAGLHRVLNHVEALKRSRAIVVVAGMEGALPSVVGGLVDRPIVAVPTSIGYGVNFKGLAALLAMLNSCAPGVTVVNIDNGFGAGVAAALINRVGEPAS
ncbi:MAG: nickel pincer cofactor biosynthesis protein LarB [Kiritimatiellaeota bacterium]|nr:nickel pincer cofactor biosynthesis protein LarB [Kiritimatiellota bacterium]